ncbi:MAG TPA: VOC family protein [Candidatus Eisenbacteria bacterium]|jgi:methylmalonyl-CoA/ethylmalonyl-CoA epimerase
MTQIGSSLALSKIGQICVNVRDLDRATTFYGESLGMRLLFQVPKMSFFDAGGVRLMLGLPESPEFDHPSSVLYFKVDDIQGAYAALSERQVTFTDRPHLVAKLSDHELWMTFFKDTEGNTLALMSEVRA